MKYRISIALATFNGERHLSEQLHSFLLQTRQPDELIISDDGSTDGTIAIANKFAKECQFEVRIFRNLVNLGYAQNFSRALQYCTGDIVFISDQDDVWLPEKIERIVQNFAEKPEVQLLIHDLEYCKADLTPIGQTKIGRMQGAFDLNFKFVVGMATAVRGPFLKLCLPIPDVDDLSHDFWLHRCADLLDKKIIIHEVLAMYRRHVSTVTNVGDLNVDFFTTADHFKSAAYRNKTNLPEVQFRVLFEWLQSRRNVLIECGYVSSDYIDNVIRVEQRRIECMAARARILAMGKWRRVWPVLFLWGRGGYRYFSGWKSAAKDILLN